MCVFVCVCERERERERGHTRGRAPADVSCGTEKKRRGEGKVVSDGIQAREGQTASRGGGGAEMCKETHDPTG